MGVERQVGQVVRVGVVDAAHVWESDDRGPRRRALHFVAALGVYRHVPHLERTRPAEPYTAMGKQSGHVVAGPAAAAAVVTCAPMYRCTMYEQTVRDAVSGPTVHLGNQPSEHSQYEMAMDTTGGSTTGRPIANSSN